MTSAVELIQVELWQSDFSSREQRSSLICAQQRSSRHCHVFFLFREPARTPPREQPACGRCRQERSHRTSSFRPLRIDDAASESGTKHLLGHHLTKAKPAAIGIKSHIIVAQQMPSGIDESRRASSGDQDDAGGSFIRVVAHRETVLRHWTVRVRERDGDLDAGCQSGGDSAPPARVWHRLCGQLRGI